MQKETQVDPYKSLFRGLGSWDDVKVTSSETLRPYSHSDFSTSYAPYYMASAMVRIQENIPAQTEQVEQKAVSKNELNEYIVLGAGVTFALTSIGLLVSAEPPLQYVGAAGFIACIVTPIALAVHETIQTERKNNVVK